MINNRKTLLVSAVSATALLSATAAFAAEVDLTAEFAVMSDVSITEIQPISFGTLIAVQSEYDQAASLVMKPDGTMDITSSFVGPNGGQASLIQSEAGQQGIFEVNLGYPEISLTVDVNKTFDLTHTDGSSTLSATAFTAEGVITGEGGDTHTNADGILQFQVGGTIQTKPDSKTFGDASIVTKGLPDGTYTGTLPVDVTL